MKFLKNGKKSSEALSGFIGALQIFILRRAFN